MNLRYICCGRITGAPLPPVVALLEGAAGAQLTQPGDAVEVVGGHELVLLLNEAESWEVEPGTLALSVLNHGGKRVLGAWDEQVEEAGVAWERGDRGVTAVQQDMVLTCQVGSFDLNINVSP